MTTIPASDLVNVTPSVESAGGTAVDVIALVLSDNPRIPIGQVLGFASGPAVATYFGSGSTEAVIAQGGSGLGSGYFGGFKNSNKKPSNLLFARFNLTAAAAFMRGGQVSGLSLAQLQAISGTLDVTIDGYPHNDAALDLSAATSFSSAAALIQSGINGSLPTEASVTGSIDPETFSCTASIAGNIMTVTNVASGTIVNGAAIAGTGVAADTAITGQLSGTAGGIGTYAVNNAQVVASETITGSYGQVTVTVVGSGVVAVGQTVGGSGVTAGTIITQLGTGTGDTGTYFVNLTQTVASEALTMTPTAATVAYDSVSGAFVITSGIAGPASTIAFATGTTAATLCLTSATGAVLSQGAAPAIPATLMDSLVSINSNWVTFFTSFDPDDGSGSYVKQQLAAWKNGKNNRFAYIAWDVDASPTTVSPATGSLGYVLANNGDSGTFLISEPSGDLNHAAFVAGAAASIDFTQRNGRISFAYKQQDGLVAAITDETAATNLGGNPQSSSRGNGYNFYGAYSNANQNFVSLQRGFVTGQFSWFDTYVNQVWMNSLFQSALINLELASRSIPYSVDGTSAMDAALSDPIQQARTFGAFGPAALSSTQIAQVNADAGANIADTLQTQGYYLQILQASPTVRAARTSPPAKFWYIDQGSVQAINLNSEALL